MVFLVFMDPEQHFCGFRKFWLPVALDDMSTFHQLLSNILAAKCANQTAQDTTDEKFHHWAATAQLAQQVSNISKAQVSTVVSAILSLVQYGNIQDDEVQYQLHFKALRQLVQFNGGISHLKMPRVVRLLVLFVEVSACARWDSPPFFPLPIELQAALPNLLGGPPPVYPDDDGQQDHLSITFLDADDPLRSALHALRDLGETVTQRFQSEGDRVWADANIPGSCICVLLHRLLSLSTAATESTCPVVCLREATRLCALMGLASLRLRFRAFRISSAIYLEKLRPHLETLTQDLAPYNNDVLAVLLWQVFMFAVDCVGMNEKQKLSRNISMISAQLHLNSWEDVLKILRRIFWVEPVHSFRGRVIWQLSQSTPKPSLEVITRGQ